MRNARVHTLIYRACTYATGLHTPPPSFLRNTFFMDLSLGDRVFYTRSNGVRVPATVVGMAGDGLIHLEYYQDALRVVNRQCKMESMCT